MTDDEIAFEQMVEEIEMRSEAEVLERIRNDAEYREKMLWSRDPDLRTEVVWDCLEYLDTYETVMEELNRIAFMPSK